MGRSLAPPSLLSPDSPPFCPVDLPVQAFSHLITMLSSCCSSPPTQCSQGHSTLWQIPSFHTLWLKPSPSHKPFRQTPQSLMDTCILSVNREHGCAGVCASLVSAEFHVRLGARLVLAVCVTFEPQHTARPQPLLRFPSPTSSAIEFLHISSSICHFPFLDCIPLAAVRIAICGFHQALPQRA